MKKRIKSETTSLYHKNIGTLSDTEEKLRIAYHYVRSLLEASLDPLVTINADGKITDVNLATENATGFPRDYLIGTDFSDYFTDPEKAKIGYQKVFEKGRVIDYPLSIRHKSNKIIDVLYNAIVYRDEQGKIVGVFAAARDITERKRADELIIAKKKLDFQFKEKEKHAAELINANNKLTLQNREIEKRVDELFMANKELSFQNEEKKKLADELIIANKELAFQKDEKGKRAAELIIANKELVVQNREKEKRADELIIANKELAFQNGEKGKRAEELIIANKELEFQNEVNKVLEQFTYVVSHNLQEPLRTISNYIQVFEEDYSKILDENACKYLNLMDDSTKRMSMLLNSLSDISRLGRNIKLTNVDCKKIINDVIADLDTLIKTSNANIEVTEMPVLNGYEIELRQLFQNLITNAIKFQKKDIQPKINIRSEKINDKWKFSISDNGIGVASVDFERIFDIFQRLHTDAEYEGNGIGLSNCKKIVQLHHGEIWIESYLGQGSTFHFTIPNLTV
jgi:PAS domain S-box-containing protein